MGYEYITNIVTEMIHHINQVCLNKSNIQTKYFYMK